MILAFLLGCLGFVLVGGGALLGFFAWRNFQTGSRVGCPRSRIAKLRPGFRKVRGQVAPLGEPLRSPVTDRPCVYYRLRVYEDRSRSKSPASDDDVLVARVVGGAAGALAYKATTALAEDMDAWQLLLDEALSIPLVIEDDTGAVEVDLRGATVLIKEKSCIASGLRRPIPTMLTDLLREEYGIHRVTERGWVKTMNFVEEALLVGSKVTVVGTVEPLKSGPLCFQKKGDTFLVSEREVEKEGRKARSRAIGFAVGFGSAVAVALIVLLAAGIFAVRALLAGR
jgi:hypothetical protein